MKNRYKKGLKKHNQQILTLLPANQVLRYVMALEVKIAHKKGNRVIDIGCGEGDSAEPILECTGAKMDLLDVSSEMIRSAKKNLARHKNRVRYICADAKEYLEKSKSYDIILSSWTIHNFKQSDKKKLLNLIYKRLNKGGHFILSDKIYPGKGGGDLLALQLKRYRYLDSEGRKEISDHEKKDHTKKYRMEEKSLLKLLEQIGFSKITIADRVEREIVLVAKK